MIGFLLSLGAVNALIPLLVIIILIGAAGMSMRGFSFFQLFGLETIFGVPGAGKNPLKKPITESAYGRKGVLRGARVKIGATLHNALPGGIGFGYKIKDTSKSKLFKPVYKTTGFVGIGTKAYMTRQDKNQFVNEGIVTLALGSEEIDRLKKKHEKDAERGGEEAYRKDLAKKAREARVRGLAKNSVANEPGHLTKFLKYPGELEALRQRYPHGEASYKRELAERTQGPEKYNERGYSSLVTAGFLKERQKYLSSLQAEYEKSFSKAKEELAALDKERERMGKDMTERDYQSKRNQIMKEFKKAAAKYHDSTMAGGATIAAAGAAVKGVGYAIAGDKQAANASFKAAGYKAIGSRYKYDQPSGKSFAAQGEQGAAQYNPGGGRVVSTKEELETAQYRARKKKAEEEEEEKKKKEAEEKKSKEENSKS